MLQGFPNQDLGQSRWKDFTSSAIMCVVLAMILAACSGATAPTDPASPNDQTESPDDAPTDASTAAPTEGGTLVLSYLSEPDTLDPHRTVAPNAEIVLRLIGGSLIEFDPNTGELVPAVLESWDASADGLVWTLVIRPDVKFHSGKKLTADDLRSTWERGLGEGSTVASLLGDIEQMVVIDDETLEVHHNVPLAGFAANLASTFLQPIDPEALALGDDDYGQHPASVGPFIFQERTVGAEIKLIRNPDYSWAPAFYNNQGPAYPTEVVIRNISEDATRMASLETGEVGIAIVGLTAVDRMVDHPDVDVKNFLRTGVSTLAWINHDSPPLDDLNVRLALNHAVDRETIVAIATDGHGEAAYWPVPPWSQYYWDGADAIAPTYNPDEARRLLDEAGWVEGSDGMRESNGQPLVLTLFSQAIPAWESAGSIIQGNLRDIGIQLEIEVYDGPTMRQYSREGRHDLSFLGYSGDEMNALYRHFHSSQIDPQTGWNMSNYRNSEVDRLLDEQAGTTDMDARLALAADLQKVMIEDGATLPLFIYRNFWGAHQSVRGFDLSQVVGSDANALLLHDVWIDRS